jgi:hypothetical protein
MLFQFFGIETAPMSKKPRVTTPAIKKSETKENEEWR